MVFNATFNNISVISYIVVVSFISEGDRSKNQRVLRIYIFYLL
jgi:hypothetical protein